MGEVLTGVGEMLRRVARAEAAERHAARKKVATGTWLEV